MMAAQMVAVHNASMECFRRAMLDGATFDGRDMNLKHAEKLTNCYGSLVNTLQKYRGKGQEALIHVRIPSLVVRFRAIVHPFFIA